MTLRWIPRLILLGLAGFAGLLLWGHARRHPENLPWTSLDLGRPIGTFTGRKLAALGDEPGRCRALLHGAGVRFTQIPDRRQSGQCGYFDAIRPATSGALDIGFRPDEPGISCPVAASLALWEWHVVQPAALRHFGTKVSTIDHLGSYSCRRMYGRRTGSWSEHASANALDVAGFRLANGESISVFRDWPGGGAKAAFLRDVRDGACRLFATTLSPDYNAAHRDHLHLDQAGRGALGWRACK